MCDTLLEGEVHTTVMIHSTTPVCMCIYIAKHQLNYSNDKACDIGQLLRRGSQFVRKTVLLEQPSPSMLVLYVLTFSRLRVPWASAEPNSCRALSTKRTKRRPQRSRLLYDQELFFVLPSRFGCWVSTAHHNHQAPV